MLMRFLAVMVSLMLSATCPAVIPVVTGNVWPDTDGNHINCHGGAILQGPDGVFYWYGEHRGYNKAPQEGVACYTSTDLTNWQNRGIVMAVSDEPGALIERGSTIERPKVVYNAATGKYVMWFHHELKGRGYAAAQTAVAVADNPLGPFIPLRTGRVNAGCLPLGLSADSAPDPGKNREWWTDEWRADVEAGLFTFRDLDGGQMSRDMTIFVDDDSTAYHIYSSEENLTLHIARLSDDYTTHTGEYVRVMPGGMNEAPAIFKRDGRYWMVTSGCTGWAPNEARMFRADSIFGPWHQVANPCRGEGAEKTFGAQGTFMLRLGDEITFMADRWNPKSLPDSRHLWLPVGFDSEGVPVICYEDESKE